MPKPPIASPPDQAAAWRARLSAGEPSAADRAAFQAWRSARPENDAAWALVERTWSRSGRLGDDPLVRRLIAGAPPPPRARPWTFAAAAAAAALAVLAGVALVVGRPAAPVAPLLVQGQAVAVLTTGGRASASLTLSDGSRIVLLRGATFAPARGLRRGGELLSGEAAFDVVHDAGRPFVVEAAGRTVTALGTLFSVDVSTSVPRVALRRGSVRVADGSRWVMLKPGQEVVATSGFSPWRLSSRDLQRDLAWAEDRVTFNGQTLEEIAGEMNRRSDVRLELTGGLSNERFSGAFENGDVRSLAQALVASGRAHPIPAPWGTLRLGRTEHP